MDGKFTLKNYYMSQRVNYNCIQSMLFCLSNGMNLASLKTDEEISNLLNIAWKNMKLFKDEFFVNSIFGESLCQAIKGNVINYNANLEQKIKFLCEDVVVADNFDEPKTVEFVDVKSTFFDPLGSFVTDDVTKNYFLSRMYLTPPEATIACKSFGMVFASPENQQEYDNLRDLMQEHDNPAAAIAAFRSELDNEIWIDGQGKLLNYIMKWAEGEPSNLYGNEHCVFFRDALSAPMNDVPCDKAYQFICEDNQEIKVDKQIEPKDVAKLMVEQQISSYDQLLDERIIYYRSRRSIKLSWFESKLMCQSIGMEMFAPKDNDEYDNGRAFLSDNESFHVGLTTMGTDNIWYSVNSGKVVTDDFSVPFPYMTEKDSNMCLVVSKIDGTYGAQAADCTDKRNFICGFKVPSDAYQYKVASNDDYED